MAISIIQIDGNEYPLGSSASNVVFNSTGTGIEAGNVQEAIEAVKLRAGDNITIENGVISATGGGSQGGGEEQEGTFAELDVDSRLKHIQSPVMVLDCISQSEEPGIADCPIGGYYCYMGNQASACRIRYRKARVTAGLYDDIDLSSPQGHVLYYNKPEDKTYRWDGQRLVAVLWHAGLAIDNRLMSSRATAVVLWYISANLVDGEIHMDPQSGDVYCDSNNHIIVKGGTVNPNKEYRAAANLPTTTDADLGLPDQKLVYYDVNKKDFYRWNGVEWKKALDIDIDTTNLVTITQLNNTLSSYATKSYVDQAVQQAEQPETVVINSDGANIVDGHSNSKLTAPSSRLEKELYLNLKALYDNLAGIAFSGTAPQWQTVAAPKYSITAGTLSQVTATYNGTALPATNVNEGEVTIVLTPDSGTALADGDIHITIGGKEVRFTRSGNNVTFVLSGDATVAATAFDGITVNAPAAGSNFTIDKSSVRLNTANETVELTPNEHCSWANPVNVVVTYGVDNITNQCSIVESGGKQVITLPALSDGSKTITVTASAVVNQHITVTFPSNHANMVIKHGNSELTGDSVVVYSDMLNYAITFQAKDGHRFDDVPSVGGTALSESGGIYTLTVDSVSADITVVATTEKIPVHTLTINTARMSGCHIEYNGNEMTPTNNVVTIGNITDGSNVSFRVVPNAGNALQSLSYTIDGISQQTTNPDGAGETITLNTVTSNVAVAVTATTAQVTNVTINLPNVDGVTFKDSQSNPISGAQSIPNYGSDVSFSFSVHGADTDASNDNKTYYISSVKAVDHTTQTEIPLAATSNDDGHTVSVEMSGLSGEIDIEVKAFYLFLDRIVNDTTGGLSTQEGWAATDYIDISAYGRYTFHRGLANVKDFTDNVPNLASDRASYIFYDSSKTKQGYSSVGSSNEQRRSMITRASAEGIVYVRASIPIKTIGVWFMMDTSEDGQGGFVNEIIGSYKGFNYKGQFDNGIFGKLYGSSSHEFADSTYGYTSEMFEFDPSAAHTYAYKFTNPGGIYFLDSEDGYVAAYTTSNYWSGSQTGKKPTASGASKMFISIDNYVDGHYLYDETDKEWLFRGFSVDENLYNGNS